MPTRRPPAARAGSRRLENPTCEYTCIYSLTTVYTHLYTVQAFSSPIQSLRKGTGTFSRLLQPGAVFWCTWRQRADGDRRSGRQAGRADGGGRGRCAGGGRRAGGRFGALGGSEPVFEHFQAARSAKRRRPLPQSARNSLAAWKCAKSGCRRRGAARGASRNGALRKGTGTFSRAPGTRPRRRARKPPGRAGVSEKCLSPF